MYSILSMPEPLALSVPARVTLTSDVYQPLVPFGAAGADVAVVVGAVVSAPGGQLSGVIRK